MEWRNVARCEGLLRVHLAGRRQNICPMPSKGTIARCDFVLVNIPCADIAPCLHILLGILRK